MKKHFYILWLIIVQYSLAQNKNTVGFGLYFIQSNVVSVTKNDGVFGVFKKEGAEPVTTGADLFVDRKLYSDSTKSVNAQIKVLIFNQNSGLYVDSFTEARVLERHLSIPLLLGISICNDKKIGLDLYAGLNYITLLSQEYQPTHPLQKLSPKFNNVYGLGSYNKLGYIAKIEAFFNLSQSVYIHTGLLVQSDFRNVFFSSTGVPIAILSKSSCGIFGIGIRW